MDWTLSAFADEAGPSSDEQIVALQRDDLKHIDPRSVDGSNIAALPLDAAEAFAAKLGAAGISVQMYGSPVGKIDITDDLQSDLDRLEHLGRLKDVLGCNAVRIFSFYNKTGVPKDQWADQAMDRLKQLRDKAGQLGLVLYHENESDIFGDHSDDVLRIAELRDDQTFKLIYDFANYIRTGEAGWDTWQKLKALTDCFHFKDQKKTGEHVPMGHGDTDSTKILKDAADAGWAGPVTLEPHLKFSDAVLATGVHGSGAATLKDAPAAETFHIAAQAAHAIIKDAGANVA